MIDGFTSRKERSKEDIRQAAWELFSQFGVEKVSMMDIARKAGVSQATIYNNFDSKDTLVREFVSTVIDTLVKRAHEVLSPNKPYWEKMMSLIQFISEMTSQSRFLEFDATVFSSNADLLNDPEIQIIYDSAQEKMTDLLLGIVQEGREQGEIRPDLSEDAFRVYFRAFMEIFIDPQFQRRYSKDPKLAQDLSMLMIYGMSWEHS